jgi:hypothetical protein
MLGALTRFRERKRYGASEAYKHEITALFSTSW